MANEDVIRFENLRQKSSVVGEQTEVVKAKAKPFVSSNAHGVLREVNSLADVADLGAQFGSKALAAIKAK